MDAAVINKIWNEAKPRAQGVPYIEPGTYELEVLVSKLVESTKSLGETYFVAEFKVLKSTNQKFNTGDVVCLMGNMKYGSFVSDAKQFVAECTQSPFEKVTPEILANVVHPEKNPLKGTVIHCIAEDKPSQKTGKLYTRYRWRLMELAPTFKGKK